MSEVEVKNITKTWQKLSDLSGLAFENGKKYQMQNTIGDIDKNMIRNIRPSIRYIETAEAPDNDAIGGEILGYGAVIYTAGADDLYVKKFWGDPVLVISEV